jgi:hypothetical protein
MAFDSHPNTDPTVKLLTLPVCCTHGKLTAMEGKRPDREKCIRQIGPDLYEVDHSGSGLLLVPSEGTNVTWL